MTDYQTITYALSEGCVTLTLNRPQALNAIDPVMMDELGEAVRRADADDAVRALIVTGAGERAFCSGMDLRAFAGRTAATTPLAARGGRRGYRHPLALFSKPAISAINGLAYGGGLELALLCDL